MEAQTISLETVPVYRGSMEFALFRCPILCCLFSAGTELACRGGRLDLFMYLLSCVSVALIAL